MGVGVGVALANLPRLPLEFCYLNPPPPLHTLPPVSLSNNLRRRWAPSSVLGPAISVLVPVLVRKHGKWSLLPSPSAVAIAFPLQPPQPIILACSLHCVQLDALAVLQGSISTHSIAQKLSDSGWPRSALHEMLLQWALSPLVTPHYLRQPTSSELRPLFSQ